MDVFKPALDNSLSPKAAPSEETEADVFRWPTPEAAPCSAQDAEPAARGYWTAVFDYEATADDELSLQKGDVVEVLSKDSLVSGDEGWWTGMIADRVGIFPSNYVSNGNGIPEEIRDTPEQQYLVPPLHREYPIVPHISVDEISLLWLHYALTYRPSVFPCYPLAVDGEPHAQSAVSWRAQCTPVGLETGWQSILTASGPAFRRQSMSTHPPNQTPPHTHLSTPVECSETTLKRTGLIFLHT